MAGKSPVMATGDQRAALKAMAGDADRAEADRARAILLTLVGRTSKRIAEAFGVCEDTVRLWRSDFMRECCPGACAGEGRGRAQNRRATSLCPGHGQNKLDAGPPCRGDHKPRAGHDLPIAALQGAAQKRGVRWRRPRHTLKGRQDRDAIDRVGLRLKLRKVQADAGDIVLLFCDESEALTHPYLARAWAKRGADLRVPAPGQSKKVAMMGTLDWTERKLIVTTSRTKRSTDFIAHLQVLDRLYGPKPGIPIKPVVIVLDNGPKYAPELNTLRWSGVTSRLIISPPTSSMRSSIKPSRP
jgi:DDE superfamily endonuclease/Homeodomain-like domain